MDEHTDGEKTGYWASFGRQQHVIPHHDPRRLGRELIALCGVVTDPDDVDSDARVVCFWCAWEVKSGRVIVKP